MACGMTPQIAEMLANMDEHQKMGVQSMSEEYQAQVEYSKQVQRRYEAVQAKLERERGYDWTRNYEKWEAWEDPDELAAKEKDLRDKSERAQMRTSCNHDHSAEQKLMDMSTQDKLIKCDTFRRLGNRFFAHGQYQRAAYHYHRALIYFEYVFCDTDDEQRQMDDLKKRALLNFALCRIKTKHTDESIHHATLALKLDADSVKALYIRAMGYRIQDKFDLAQGDLDRALSLAPDDAALIHEKHILTAKKAAYRVKSKQLGAAMFQTPSQPSFRGRRVDSTMSIELDFRQPSPSAYFESLETWQPSTRGKTELADLLKQLQANS
ncbi:hypothetical protein AC1031_001439 [Aphanomyces cochlioides]|nr:hypothetical protein AC1031_001439 [Aphanomyces cochlioides]